MADVNALYPAPPAANAGLLSGDPTKVIGLVGQLNQNALFQQMYDARKKIGEAYKGAIGPDGEVDHAKLMQGAGNAGFLAPDAVTAAQSQQSQRIQNQSAQMQHATSLYGALANVDKPTPEMVHQITATIAATMPGIPAPMVSNLATSVLKDPAGIKHGAALLQNIAVGPAAVTARTAGPPSASGAQTSQPLGSANLAGGPTPVALSPKETAAQTQAGAGAGSAVNDARVHGLNYTQQVFPLEQAISGLEKLGKTGTGPGTDEFNQVKSFLQSAGIPGFDSEKIKTFDEAKKYLTDFVNQNGNSGTNDKLAASFAGNPSVHISNAAASDVAKSALALRRMRQAQLIAFEKSGKSDDEYPKEAGKWNREHDPRAYGFDLMTPDQRKKVIEELPKGKRELFMLDVQDALQNGIIKAPR